ncbi:MAG: hypothetical protein HND52_07740 [Ignavibacteriae bacterium]|nr:hypothetical protein [Ignavibacteriota bacterium]NOG97838.1 hypothetical protein [Ignavibacteriota bacterium]
MKLFKPINLLFYFLSLINFLFIGIFYAVLTGAAKGQGLAGGAIVLGYGVIAGILALIVSIIFAYILEEKIVLLLNKILGIVFALIVVVIAYRILTIEKKEEYIPPKKQVTPAAAVVPASIKYSNQNGGQKSKMGLGMAAPNFYQNNVLYFYGSPNLDKAVNDNSPTDSVVFKRSEIGFEIAEAPPWLVPANLKMDYETFYFRIISIQYDFLEVVVNETNNQTTFIDRNKSKILFYPEFLLTVNSIEPINKQDNLVRIKPMPHVSPVNAEYDFLRPIRVKQEWIYVELLSDDFKPNGRGWIRWSKDGYLIITYSLFS